MTKKILVPTTSRLDPLCLLCVPLMPLLVLDSPDPVSVFRHGRYKLPSRCAGLRPSCQSMIKILTHAIVGRKPNVSAQPVSFGPCCHMYLHQVLIRRQVRNVHPYQMIHFVLWAYSTAVFRSSSFLQALISYELRAPCVTCERVPDLFGVTLLP